MESAEVVRLLNEAMKLTKRQRWYLAEAIANSIGYTLDEDTDEECSPQESSGD